MLLQSWEEYATKLANAESEDELVVVISDIRKAESIDAAAAASVVVGRDTR